MSMRTRSPAWRQIAAAALLVTAGTVAGPVAAHAQIARHPTGVNVSALGVTTVFITYGNLGGAVPAEAMWCGELVPASPDVGFRCDPSSIFGILPARYDLSRQSGSGVLTDIMTIPASVARRAYQAAASGANSDYFYVRRFVDPAGGPDQYVTVTCRMSAGGARTPFALTDVHVAFASADPVTVVAHGARPPAVAARIAYNGTGRLSGRWEVVRPGEEPPRAVDLLPEASLPLEQRVRQRRYSEVGRFDVFLPPVGVVTLPGPDPDRMPTDASGEYLLLLRIEATDDKEGDSDLDAARAGTGIVHGGGVAGFPIPPLRYYAGNGFSAGVATSGFRTLPPAVRMGRGVPTLFEWTAHPTALLYRVEFADMNRRHVLGALLPAAETFYRAPGWLADRVSSASLLWRVTALGAGGSVLATTPWTTRAIDETDPLRP
jgi:hypothetical protein